jgi:DNA-binding MarR family transcriptional regulator
MTPAETAGDDLPPSARFVLDVLAREDQLTRPCLQERTGLPSSTLDNALKTLESRDYIRRDRHPEDLRVVVANYREDADA